MPLRSLRSGSTFPQTFTPRLTLVAHNGQRTDRTRRETNPGAVAEQRRRSRRVAVLCFAIGLLILVTAATEMLAATS